MTVTALVLAAMVLSAWQPQAGPSDAPSPLRSPAAIVDDASVAPTPDRLPLVIGEIVDGLLPQGIESGTVVTLWRLPSRSDVDAYLKMLGVELGLDPVLTIVCEDSVEQFFKDAAELDSKWIPTLQTLSANTVDDDLTQDERQEAKVELKDCSRSLQEERSKLENGLLDRIDSAVVELLGSLPAEAGATRTEFIEARWRQRAADYSSLTGPSRCDLGLLVINICGGVGATELREAIPTVIAYWAAQNAPSKSYVTARSNSASRITQLTGSSSMSQTEEQRRERGLERAQLSATVGTPLLQRARNNVEWKAKLAAKLPASVREKFLTRARDSMFPDWPLLVPEGRWLAEAAISQLDSDQGQRRAFESILKSHLETEARIEAEIEQSFLDTIAVRYRVGTVSRAQVDEQRTEAVASYNRLQTRTVAEVINLLSPEQAKALAGFMPPSKAEVPRDSR